VKDHENRISEAESTILLLKSLGGSSSSDNDNGGKPGFLDALEILIENLRKECYSKFAEKDDLSKFKKRIADIEENVRLVTDESKNNKNSVN
jgi:hypothetical protein